MNRRLLVDEQPDEQPTSSSLTVWEVGSLKAEVEKREAATKKEAGRGAAGETGA